MRHDKHKKTEQMMRARTAAELLSMQAEKGLQFKSYEYALKGEKNELEAQKKILRDSKDPEFHLGTKGVKELALATEKEYIAALKLFFERRPLGWYKYKEDYLKYKICNKEELEQARKLYFG